MIDRQVARITLGRCPAYLTALLRARALLVPCLSSCAWMAALMNLPSGELFRVVLYELPPGISNPPSDQGCIHPEGQWQPPRRPRWG